MRMRTRHIPPPLSLSLSTPTPFAIHCRATHAHTHSHFWPLSLAKNEREIEREGEYCSHMHIPSAISNTHFARSLRISLLVNEIAQVSVVAIYVYFGRSLYALLSGAISAKLHTHTHTQLTCSYSCSCASLRNSVIHISLACQRRYV